MNALYLALLEDPIYAADYNAERVATPCRRRHGGPTSQTRRDPLWPERRDIMTNNDLLDNNALIWLRPSLCTSASCVEVALTDDSVYVRDGKNPEGPALRFDHDEWKAFRASVEAGQFSVD